MKKFLKDGMKKDFYTMGPAIDFPMIMNYTDTDTVNGQRYFYFLNGHNNVVYFADQNFTEYQIEGYEYNPFGIFNGEVKKNNIMFNGSYWDNELNYYFNHGIYYNPYINSAIYIKRIIYEKEFFNNYISMRSKLLENKYSPSISLKAQYCYATAKCQWEVDSWTECWVCKVLACDSVCFDCGIFGCSDPYAGTRVFYIAIKCFNYC